MSVSRGVEAVGQLYQELKRRNVIRVAIAYAVAAWLLIQVADTLFPILGLPGWSVTLVAVLLIVGFPVALIFAWAYELTPEGIKPEKHVPPEESITHLTGRKLDFIVIALLVVALGFFSYDKFVLDPGRDAELVRDVTEAITEQTAEMQADEATDLSIAVLPFSDLSPAGDHEYFSDGVSEEILNVLARIPDLRVISRSSAFSFKGKNVDIKTVAGQLGVAHVLEGSVRKAGSRVRITAQLIDARKDAHLWSETYDRELDDIFKVQDEISTAVAGALKQHLGLRTDQASSASTTTNIEAHDAYLRGRYLVAQDSPASFEGAFREFERAIALDPDYALAYADLAVAILRMGRRFAGLTETEAFAQATPHVKRAMALDSSLAEAQFAAGYLWLRENPEVALAHYKQAIRINPNYATAYGAMGYVLTVEFGRYAEAFVAYKSALLLDPLSIAGRYNYVLNLYKRNRFDDADEEIQKLASISPETYLYLRGFLRSRGGQWTDAILGSLDSLQVDPDERRPHWDFLSTPLAVIGLEKEALAASSRPYVLRILGRSRDAITAAEARLAKDPTNNFLRRNLGMAFASAGDYERARPILEELWARSDRKVTVENLIRPIGAAALIVIRRDSGAETEVHELVEAIRNDVRRRREAEISRARLGYSVDFAEGIAAYLAGEREQGLALIARGAEDGYFIPLSEAYLQALYDDPGFAPIRTAQEARQTRERERFLAVVCVDNPYESVWQPAEGTCERFASAQ